MQGGGGGGRINTVDKTSATLRAGVISFVGSPMFLALLRTFRPCAKGMQGNALKYTRKQLSL